MSEREALVEGMQRVVARLVACYGINSKEANTARAAIAALTAQQEPVAWMWPHTPDADCPLKPGSWRTSMCFGIEKPQGRSDAIPLYTAPQPDGVVVPRQRLVDLKDWNERYPAGRVYGYSAAVKMERELQAAITPIIALLAAAKEPRK